MGIKTLFHHLLFPKPNEARIGELIRTEERYHLLANHIHEVIFTMDMNLKYTYISPSIERQRGFTVKEATALPFDKNVTPESARRIIELVAKGIDKLKKKSPSTLPGRSPSRFTARTVPPDGPS